MRTIGAFLKEARVAKKYSRGEVSDQTKIKGEFIAAIEREDWEKLPDFAVVVGFVKKFSLLFGG